MSLGAAPVPRLVGQRCSLRALTPADAPASARHADDPHRLPACGQVWAVDVAGEAIGCASVRPDSGWLALLTAWTRANLPAVQRLHAPIFARNGGSQGVARRAGFQWEGRRPRSRIKAGEVIDGVRWAACRPDAAVATAA